MNIVSTQPNASRFDVFILRGLTALALAGIAWVSYLSIPIVTDIDGTFSRWALRDADPSQPRLLADHASSQGALLVRYHVPVAAVAIALPLAALVAMRLRPGRRFAVLCLLFLTGTGIFCFSVIAIITST